MWQSSSSKSPPCGALHMGSQQATSRGRTSLAQRTGRDATLLGGALQRFSQGLCSVVASAQSQGSLCHCAPLQGGGLSETLPLPIESLASLACTALSHPLLWRPKIIPTGICICDRNSLTRSILPNHSCQISWTALPKSQVTQRREATGQ